MFPTICFLLNTFLPAQRPVDVIHYRFEIEVQDRNDSIYGKASILFRATQEANTLDWDLTSPDASGKTGMRVLSLRLDKKEIAFHQSDNKVRLKLEQSLVANKHYQLEVQYAGIPADGLIISLTKYGRRSFFADNWPNRGQNWLFCNDDPGDKAMVDFAITAPAKYQVVANGIQVEESNLPDNRKRTVWKESVSIATKVMVIGVAEMAVELAGFVDDCTPVYSYVYPEDRDNGFYDYALTIDILKYFIKQVGPYGYRKLANVQSKTTFGGLENANTIFYSESSVDGNRSKEALMAHEVAHQWFGNMAGEKSFAHLWLSEGFATYMTILYMENRYGSDTAIKMLKEDRIQVANFARKDQMPVVDETEDYMQLLNANSYQKGGWVLHMLRAQLGDSLFGSGIRAYYKQYSGSNADTRDFQRVMENTTGKSLAAFFDQWLYKAGIPLIKMQWSYATPKKKLALRIQQMQPQVFQFPLTVEITSENGKRRLEKLDIHLADERFEFDINDKIKQVTLDPKTELLFEHVN